MKNSSNSTVPPYWHLNFLNKGRLPDIKAQKQIKAMSLLMALIAIGLGVLYIYKISADIVLNDKIQGLNKALERGNSINLQNQKLLKEFQLRVNFIKAFQAFSNDSINPVMLLAALAQNRPEILEVSEVNFIPSQAKFDSRLKDATYQIELRGTISENYSQALTVLNSFSEAFSKVEAIKNQLVAFEVKDVGNNQDSQTKTPYSIIITLKGVS